MAQNSGSWLLFVDTNILLDFYRLGGESAARQLEALERHKELLITCDQVHMEYLKNRQKVILDSMRSLPKPVRPSIPPILADYQSAGSLKKAYADMEGYHSKVRDKIEKVLREPSQHDPVYKALRRIFENDCAFNLRRDNKAKLEIRRLARKRFCLGYPPRKSSDSSIGDAVNWEWIIRCAKISPESSNILIVSRDSDYGVTLPNNDVALNDWLRLEFKERVSRRRQIEFTNRLTFALKKLDVQVAPEDVQEEDRIIEQERNSTQSANADFFLNVSELSKFFQNDGPFFRKDLPPISGQPQTEVPPEK